MSEPRGILLSHDVAKYRIRLSSAKTARPACWSSRETSGHLPRQYYVY